MATIKPLADRIIIEIEDIKEEVSASGIIVPRQEPRGTIKVDKAKVISVGPGLTSLNTGELIPCIVKPGDTILINPAAVRVIKLGINEEYAYICEKDVVAIME